MDTQRWMGSMAVTFLACGTGVLTGCETSSAMRGGADAPVHAVVTEAVLTEPGSSSRLVSSAYRLSSPDRVSVQGVIDGVEFSVWDLAIDAGGSVPIPEVGLVKLAGLTVVEASVEATDLAKTLDPSAVVTVSIERLVSQHVYAFGQLSDTGPIAWEPGLRLLDVIGDVSLLEDADTTRVDVIRPDADGVVNRRVTVNLDRLLEVDDADVNVVMMPGDVVYVPEHADGPPMWMVMNEKTWAAAQAAWFSTEVMESPDAMMFAAYGASEDDASVVETAEPELQQVEEPWISSGALSGVETGSDVVFWE